MEIEYRKTKALVQYFELLDEDGYLGLPASALNKFWEISILGNEVTERSGKIGTPGKTNNLKLFKSEELARQYVEKMIVEKKWRKDYTDRSTQLYQASATLAALVGSEPLTVEEAMKALGDYIKGLGLRDNIWVTSDARLLSLTGSEKFQWLGELDCVRENLIYIPGSFRKVESRISAVEAPRQGKAEKLFTWIHLGKNEVLKGPYQKNMDLKGQNIKTKVFLHMQDAFKQAAAEGRPPQPNICVANDGVLEVLHFPSDAVGVEYAVIENLPNLREVHIGPAKPGALSLVNLRWLILQNLPKLESITVDGGLRWLDIHSVPALSAIDVRKAKSLDHFCVTDSPSLANLQIEGCAKLRNIVGISESDETRLFVRQQITSNQAASRFDGTMYPDMTFTDVDHVMTVINQGAKLATVAGKLDPDFCYGQELNPDFNRFSFRLLRPLEHVYTGGTGEIYPYEAIGYDYSKKLGFGVVSSRGCSSQEDCLDHALNTMVDFGIEIPGVKKINAAAVLKALITTKQADH